jgi:hypothetical protein
VVSPNGIEFEEREEKRDEAHHRAEGHRAAAFETTPSCQKAPSCMERRSAIWTTKAQRSASPVHSKRSRSSFLFVSWPSSFRSLCSSLY